MFDAKLIKQDFSKAAQQYDNHAKLQQQVLEELVNKAKPLLTPNAKIFDAGCGTGRLADLISGDIIQLDIAHNMCEMAAKNGKPTINGDISNLPFADNSFDVVFSSLALQWSPELEKSLDEIKRVLKPNGIMAISSFGSKTLYELKSSFAVIDNFAHISDFANLPNAETQIITDYFVDIYEIMRHLKAIGARNKMSNRRKSLMTKKQFGLIENYYRKNFANEKGLPVSWEVMYLVK